MSGILHNTVWPISYDVRPRPRHRIFTADDVDPTLLALYPRLVDELNLCPLDVWRGQGQPGPGWDGWEYDFISLEVAVGLPCGGEA